MSAIDIIIKMAENFEVVANLILSYAAYKWYKGEQWAEVKLSIGSFRVKRKHMDLPTLTAIVSQTFYEGGWLPDGIRKELLVITTPSIKELQLFKENPVSEESGKGVPPPAKK